MASIQSEDSGWSHAALLQSCAEAAFVLNGYHIEDCNEDALSWLGYPREDLLHHHPARISAQLQSNGQPSMDVFNQHMGTAIQSGRDRFDWMFVSRSGEDLPCEISLRPLKSQGRVFCSMHDTRKFLNLQRNLSRAMDRYRTLFDASPDPMWLLSRNMFVDCNEAAVRALGYPDKASLLNKHPSELSPDVQPDAERSYDKANRMGKMAWKLGQHRFEWTHKRADGTEFLAEVVLAPVELDMQSLMFCSWRDVSARKRHEDMLLAIISDLHEKLQPVE